MELLIALAASVSLLVPGRTSSTPSVAADGAFVVVAWGAADASGATDIFTAVSCDGACSFDPPVRVGSPGEARTNGEQPPRVVLSHRASGPPRVTIVWGAKGRQGTKLVSAQSEDGGRSYQDSRTLADTDAPGNAAGTTPSRTHPAGCSPSVWTIERSPETMPAAHHGGADASPDGVAMAQKSRLYIQSLDGAVVPHALTQGVCYCCKTALAVDARGVLHAAWRHVYPGNLRDIAYARSTDGGKTFTSPMRISEDGWMFEGCPDDGPAMAVDAGGRVHVVWPTLVAGDGDAATIALFYASSGGEAFTPRLLLPTDGIAHHPQIAVDGHGGIVAAWDEIAAGARRVVLARASRSDAGADLRFTRSVLTTDGAAVYPSIAAGPDATIIVWTARSGSESRIAVRRQEY